ncbi:MAG: ROK family protein [Nakamurella sp.]
MLEASATTMVRMPRAAGGNRAAQRATVLRLLSMGPRTQVAMLDECDLSQPVLTRVVHGLVTDGLVHMLGKAESTGGRRPILLGLRADSRAVLGIQLTRGGIDLSVVDLCGEQVRRHAVAWSGRRLEPAAIAAAIRDAGLLQIPVAGVSVAAPGVVDPETGAVSEAPDLGWCDPVPLRFELARRLGLPVSVDNDVNVMCVGEHDGGALAGSESGAILYVGRGIGAAIMVDGRPQPGSRGAGAEVGLIPVGPGAAARRLEDVYSVPSLARRLGLRGTAARSAVRTLFRQSAAGDRRAAAIAQDMLDGWAFAVCVLALTADPDRIALSGSLCEMDDAQLDAMRTAVYARLPNPIELRLAELGEEAVLRGAAAAGLREAINSGLTTAHG